MAGNTRADGPVTPGDLVMERRLRPAEVHSIIRQQLERLATSWDLEPTDAYRLTRQMRTHIYAPGEIILPYQVRADFLGLIVRGQAAAYGGQQRADRQVAVLLPGSTFGDVTPQQNRPSETTLQAITRCEVRFLPRADLEALASEQRAKRYAATFWRLLAWGALILVVFLAAILALRLTPIRRAMAVVPMGLGQWCSQQTRESDASPAYDRCVERAWTAAANLAPADANPRLALGTFYFERGEMEAAKQSFEAAGVLAPDLAEIHNNLGLIYIRQGEYEQAIAAFQRALELEPGTAATEHNLGFSLQAVHAYDEALNHYQLALAFGEPRPSTLANMAIGYYETRQLGKAVDAAQQALAYDEAMAPAHMVLGVVALESQQPEVALAHLQRAIVLDDSYIQAYFYLGLTYKALDQPVEAIAAFEQALATANDTGLLDQVRLHLKELYAAEEQDRSP